MFRSIVHLDADAFFASVEQSADARLRGKPIAVGGEKRGIVASASYEARQFGIYTPMPVAIARRLCPRLIVLPGDFEKYELFSRLMFSYAYDFTPDVEIGSIDEGYFDLTGVRRPAVDIAETIRRAIRQALKLSVSEGIAANKLISQIASKLKKPSAFQFVPFGSEAQFLAPLANKWLPGIGPKTANQLNAAGLARIGQVAATPPDLLHLLVGNSALQVRNFARGLDERPVVPARAAAKSYGEQTTFAADTTDEAFLDATLRRMADRLMAKVRADGKSIRACTVKVRYNDMDEEQAGESLAEPTDLETDIYGKVSLLLRKAWRRRVSLRLVSLKLSNVYEGRLCGGLGLEVADRRHDAEERLAGIVDELRQKFGRSALLRGHDFILRAKKDRGEEPTADGSIPPAPAKPTGEATRPGAIKPRPVLGFGPGNLRAGGRPVVPPPATGRRDNASPVAKYPAAMLERQRLGHYAARRAGGTTEPRPVISPGPELRFRVPATVSVNRRVVARSTAAFVPLNVHSYYSFLDSTLSIKALVDLAVKYEMPAIALTDSGNLHGAIEFAQAAAGAGIKPIIGAELKWNGQRLCLYVENETGYHHLCQLLSDPLPPGPIGGGKARAATVEKSGPGRELDAATLRERTEGLLAVSASAELAPLFPGRFYQEIGDRAALETRSAKLPGVVSIPVHYGGTGDRWKYDIVQSIRTLTLLRQAHREKRLAGDYHFRTPAEAQALFADQPDLLAHSRELADRCSFAFQLGRPQFPSFPPGNGVAPAEFLRQLVMAGLRRRYPDRHARLQPQLEEELAIITDVGYEEYFLVMWDILMECRRRGIDWITRGSAADSLACYCLEISSVCPIRFDLYFRRFLNKDRMALNKLPDIDVDFPHDRKDDVVDLIFEKYGPAHAAIVGGFSTFQSRSAFAEVAKVLGVSEFQVRRLTERLPHFTRANELGEAVAAAQECQELPFEEEPYRSALQMAHFLDGFPRYPKMHPCGLVLSRQTMREITPCFTSAKGYPTTHFDMDSVEAAGLIKMDILAQGGLAVMRDVKKMLAARWTAGSAPEVPPGCGTTAGAAAASVRYPPDSSAGSRDSLHEAPALLPFRTVTVQNPAFNLDLLEPWDNPAVWELIASGQARAVHHIESPAMISLSRMCAVKDIDTLIAIVSVIRPGAANQNKKMEFARRYQGLSPVCYPHPSLEPCLRSTFGLVVYEEHILQICESFAGLPPGRADVLRRALGKGKLDLIAEIALEFAACARRLGRTKAEIAEVWQLVAGFAGYAFCKAHSTAYGIEAYQSAWLKLHYPAEFMAGVLTNGKGFYDPLVYILECHRLGLSLLPPSVNQPGPEFNVVDGKIRVPVLNVKGLTRRTAETLLLERERGPFGSLPDFIRRVRPLNEEMEALIQAGAFDDFGKPRTRQYWEFKALSRSEEVMGRDRAVPAGNEPRPAPRRATNQLWLLPAGSLERLPSVALTEPERLQCLRWEEELLGYPVSDHPLALFPDIDWDSYCPINRLGEHIGRQVVTCGLVIEQRLFHQATGEPMKFITIADRTGVVETELFARTYKSYGLNTVRYRVLEIAATVEPFENNRGHSLRVLRAGKPRERSG